MKQVPHIHSNQSDCIKKVELLEQKHLILFCIPSRSVIFPRGQVTSIHKAPYRTIIKIQPIKWLNGLRIRYFIASISADKRSRACYFGVWASPVIYQIEDKALINLARQLKCYVGSRFLMSMIFSTMKQCHDQFTGQAVPCTALVEDNVIARYSIKEFIIGCFINR